MGPGNWIYGADVNLYVNASTGNDTTGNGSSALPYATIGRALEDVPAFVSQHYIINLAAGTYYEEVDVTGRYFALDLLNQFSTVSIELRGSTAATPAAPALSSTAGGTLGATTYFVKVTYVNSAGETFASAESSQAVAADNLLTVTSPAASGDATGWNVYVSTATGAETKQNSTALAVGANWTEPTSGLISGAALPAGNTMGDAYVISGATSGAPTTPSRNYCISNIGGDLFLDGVSLQYAKSVGLFQYGGATLTNDITLRHMTAAAPNGYEGIGALAILVDHHGTLETWGSLTVSDVTNGLEAQTQSRITGTGDPLNSGLANPPAWVWNITGVTGGIGLTAYAGAIIEDVSSGEFGTLTGTSVAGSVGILSQYFASIWWDGGIIGDFPTLVDAAQGGLVTSYGMTLQNATTGIKAENGGRFEMWPGNTPSFSGVTTDYAASQGGIISVPSTNYWDGNWTSTGAVNVTAGGTNQNVTLMPSGTGYTILNGNVGIGTATPGEALEIDAGNATLRVKNNGDTMGSFFGQTWGATQFGMYNPTGSTYGILAAGEKRSLFGFEGIAGKVGSLSNDFGQAVFRNVLDDGSGNASFAGNVGIGTSSPQATLDVAGQDRRKPVTFSTLAACSSTIEGETAAITDSTTNTWGATITGAGADHVLGYCDGTNWTVAAK